VRPHEQLHHTPGMRIIARVQHHAKGYGPADVAEIEEIKHVGLAEPQRYGDRLKGREYHRGRGVLPHAALPRLFVHYTTAAPAAPVATANWLTYGSIYTTVYRRCVACR